MLTHPRHGRAAAGAAAAGAHRLLRRGAAGRRRRSSARRRRSGPSDWIVPALREAGAALYRGLPLRTYIAQIFGNANDVSKGRQLPVPSGHARGALRDHVVVHRDAAPARGRHGVGGEDQRRRRGRARLPGRRRHQRGGLPRRGQLRRRLSRAGGVLLPEQPVGDLDAGDACRPRRRRSRSRRSPTAFPACASTATTCSRSTARCATRSSGRGAASGPTLIEALTYRVSRALVVGRSVALPRRDGDRALARARSDRALPRLADRAGPPRRDRGRADARRARRRGARRGGQGGARRRRRRCATLVEDVFAEVPWHLQEELAEITPLPRQKLGGVHQ